jgi:nucleoside-diphosphate-sugar epimerase
VLELVQHVLGIMGRSDLVPLIRNTTSHEVREQYLSAQKSKETLGWSPQFDMEEALSQTVAWYEKYFSSIGSTVIDQARHTVTH